MGLTDAFLGSPSPSSHAEAQGARVAVYWRPHCPFCVRLRRAVRDHADQIAWVNIWEDEEGRAFVRSVNDGNETVPTVVVDGIPLTNPDPSVVVRALAG